MSLGGLLFSGERWVWGWIWGKGRAKRMRGMMGGEAVVKKYFMREEKNQYIFNYMLFIRNIFKDKYVESKTGKMQIMQTAATTRKK